MAPVPATAAGSPDVKGKEQTVTTPAAENQPRTTTACDNGWRDILQSGAESAPIEGFSLEQLIDLQRDLMRRTGQDR
jgi:hypothetical protein